MYSLKRLMLLLCLVCSLLAFAQPPSLTLGPQGFEPVTVSIPPAEAKKLMAVTKAWATEHQRSSERVELSNVSGNSLTITVYKQNAFFYRDRGETFYHNIKLLMNVEFRDTSYNFDVSVPEIYSEEGRLLKYRIPDYFTDDGTLKEGYDGLKESLEVTVNKIAANYYNFLVNYH